MSEINPDLMTDEQLEAALSQGVEIVPPAPEGEPPPPPEPEPPPAEPVPAEPEKADEAPPPAEPEIDYEAERLRLLTEELQAKAKHWESVAGRNAGELGFIKGQLRAIQDAQAQMRQIETDGGEPDNRPTAPAPSVPDGLAEWAVQQAVQQAVGSFESSHPDVKEVQTKMAEYINASGFDMRNVLAMNNPIEAQREVSRALEEAYWHTKAAITSARRVELEAKREAIQTKAATNKLKASVSATASSPPPKPKAKTEAEMSDEEIEAAMVKALGGRW